MGRVVNSTPAQTFDNTEMTMSNVPSIFSIYQTNTSRETAGVWVKPVGEYEGAPEFKIARAGGANKRFESLQMNLMKPYQRIIQSQAKNMTEETRTLIMNLTKEAFVATCILDWKNVFNVDGDEIKFSKEQAKALFDQLPELYNDLFGYAQSLATFQDEETDANLGN